MLRLYAIASSKLINHFVLYLQRTNNNMDQFQDNNFKNKIYLKKIKILSLVNSVNINLLTFFLPSFPHSTVYRAVVPMRVYISLCNNKLKQ